MFRRPRPAERKKKLVVVSHTHWDREWYLPFQQFRAMLAEAVDDLLDLMAVDPKYRYFMLDGQTIVLEDYLEARPERESELRNLIASGRVLIGPWYVMPDEFLVSPESLVRNLLEGRRVANRFGAPMGVGYLPDPFGHISQMPQILRGFGIDSAVLWRGVGTELRHNEALWRAPDGSEVLLEWLPNGYANAAALPSAPEPLMQQLARIRARIEPGATTSHLLLMNGNDHMFPQPDIPIVIAEANRRLRDAEMVHGTLPAFLQGVRSEAEAEGVKWERVEGEFRSSEISHLLAGVLSSRMGIKQRNVRCQTLLERWAEPFATFAGLVPRPAHLESRRSYERLASEAPALLRLAWRYLLHNQPHDSICGCSIDQVHREMETRYDWCEQIADRVVSRSLDALAESLNTENALAGTPFQGGIAVFNSESGPRADFVSATVQLPSQGRELTLVAEDGRPVPYQILREHSTELASVTLGRAELQGYLRLAGPGREWPRWKLRILEKVVRTALRGHLPQLVVTAVDAVPGTDPSTVEVAVEAASGSEHNYEALSVGLRQLSSLVDRGDARLFRMRVRRRDQAEIGFVAPNVPDHGVQFLHFEPISSSPAPLQHEHAEATIENEFLSLQISQADGSARLIDRESGSIYWGINSFVDGGDAGDEYSYSPPVEDLVVSQPDREPSIVVEEDGPARKVIRVEMTFAIPVSLREDRAGRSAETVVCPITTRLALYPGVPRVDVRTEVTNLARDHRLRVHFPTRLDTRFSHADGHFAVIRRSIEPAVPVTAWKEHPATTNPQLAFVDINDGESGLAIANRGLPEFDVALLPEGPCIAVTLLRCVGWLSRDDLSTREGAAGPLIPTPEAQMLGTHTFEYAIIPHAGGWENAISHAYWFARPLRALWTGRHDGPLPAETSFLCVSPSSLIVSAVKQPEDRGRAVIVRLYNPLSMPLEGTVLTFFPVDTVELSNLAEDRGEETPVPDSRTIRARVDPHQAVTLRINPS